MHLGNSRTALFNDLLAKSHAAHKKESAIFLLRIEDTDLARSTKEFSEKLMHDLQWLGIQWQEGPQAGGDHGPYYQAQRGSIYDAYYQQLMDAKKAFWCFCTPAELSIATKSQLSAGHTPRYPGTCRHLTPEQIENKKAKGLKPALRFRSNDQESIEFDDFIQGPKRFAAEDIGDFIIRKNDESSSFMFCNAVDDALMGVTHVMRGEDHLTNTPRQLLILRALNLKAPQYGHTALILGFDGKPLSKRNGSESVEEMRAQGYFPIAVVNYLARLGHRIDNNTLLTLEELGHSFSASQISRSPARFDLAQLKFWQKEAVLKHSWEEIWQWFLPWVKEWVPQEKAELFTKTVMQNVVLPPDAEHWAKQLMSDDFSYEDSAKASINEAGNDFVKALVAAIEEHGDDYAKVQVMVAEVTQRKGKQLFMPLRALVTGMAHGPELAKIFPLLGKVGLLRRVEKQLETARQEKPAPSAT
jgi:glutamyl-tRNA synthetase